MYPHIAHYMGRVGRSASNLLSISLCIPHFTHTPSYTSFTPACAAHLDALGHACVAQQLLLRRLYLSLSLSHTHSLALSLALSPSLSLYLCLSVYILRALALRGLAT